MSSFESEAGRVESRLAAGLSKIALALKHEQWRDSSSRGLSPTQAQVLVALATAGDLTMTELASRLGLTPATVSESVAAAEQKGLVNRSRDRRDRRVTLVSLTEEGLRLADEVSGWPDFLVASLEVLEPDEQAILLRTVVKIVKRLQDEGRVPIARMCVTCSFFRPNAHPDPLRPHHCAFADSAFGDAYLRLDCADYEPSLSR